MLFKRSDRCTSWVCGMYSDSTRSIKAWYLTLLLPFELDVVCWRLRSKVLHPRGLRSSLSRPASWPSCSLRSHMLPCLGSGCGQHSVVSTGYQSTPITLAGRQQTAGCNRAHAHKNARRSQNARRSVITAGFGEQLLDYIEGETSLISMN